MKPIHNSILYTILAVIFFYVGFAKNEAIGIVAAIILAAVALYWVRKAKRK